MGYRKPCRRCGVLLDDNSNICPYCIAPDPIYGPLCPHCRVKVDENMVQCPYCKKGLWGRQVCAGCGELFDEKMTQCPKCKQKVVKEENNEKKEKKSWQFWK